MKFCRIFAVAAFMPTILGWLAMLISVFSQLSLFQAAAQGIPKRSKP
jgi:hypothetical protein